MTENPDNQGLAQPPADAQRQHPGQQNLQTGRRDGQGQQGPGEDAAENGLGGGVDTGDLQPGRTGDGGAER